MLLQSLNDFSDNSFPKGDIKYKINNLEQHKKMDFESKFLTVWSYLLREIILYILLNYTFCTTMNSTLQYFMYVHAGFDSLEGLEFLR